MENYTVERVLLGLQKEYLENYQMINKLKEYCVVNDKKVKDYYFTPITTNSNPIFCCTYNRDYSKMVLLLDKIKSLLNIYRIRLNTSIITKTNGLYRISNPKFPIQVIREDLLDFSDYVEFILNSDFVKYMNSSRIELIGQDKINVLNILPGYMGTTQGYEDTMKYNPHSNTLYFRNHNGIVDNQYIEDYLRLEVPTSSLNPYELEVINKSDVDNKKIMIPEEIKEEESVTFNICSEQEGLVLTRTTRKN